MQMTMRWFGDKFDSVKLWQIRQVPGVTGVITTLYDIPAGELWPVERIQALKKEVEDAGLTIAGIESVNIHDDIKIGKPTRDKYIENYIKTLENLAACDIKLVCYNFMPVFDWTRTDLAKMRPDGSTVLAYDQKVVDSIDPQKFFDQTNSNSNGYVMPGWEPERLSKVKELFEAYKDVDEERDEKLRYLMWLRQLKQDDPDLIKRISKLPLRARTGRKSKFIPGSTIVFIRNKRRDAFTFVRDDGSIEELTFLEAVKEFEARIDEKSVPLHDMHHEQVKTALDAFATQEEETKATKQKVNPAQGPNEKKAIAYLDGFVSIPNITEQELELINKAKRAITTGKFQQLQRDINKLKSTPILLLNI